jgi:hypothetical protein
MILLVARAQRQTSVKPAKPDKPRIYALVPAVGDRFSLVYELRGAANSRWHANGDALGGLIFLSLQKSQ